MCSRPCPLLVRPVLERLPRADEGIFRTIKRLVVKVFMPVVNICALEVVRSISSGRANVGAMNLTLILESHRMAEEAGQTHLRSDRSQQDMD